jgi:monoamine oxidase
MTESHIIVIGAGAAGLMAARELGRSGNRVTILEARGRCGGRIEPLSAAAFGYNAEGGAEFVHGEAPVTRRLLREAGLSLLPVGGARWNGVNGALSRDAQPDSQSERLYQVLADLQSDMSVADFLQQHFAAPAYDRLRHSILRMVEGYDAADPDRASVLALRDEWMNSERSQQARIAEGYGALIDFLATECRGQGAALHLDTAVSAIETIDGGVTVHGAGGAQYTGNAAILTIPLPLLSEIRLPRALRDQAKAAADIGFGNVIKLLLRFKSRWWTGSQGHDLSDLSFAITDATVPVWWTQHPAGHPVLTGWLAGPRTKDLGGLSESDLIETGLVALAGIFRSDVMQLKRDLVAARAINWANDPLARGAYSYATLDTRAAQSALSAPNSSSVFFSGEALYRGPDIGTVEAALAHGLETAQRVAAAVGDS